jgi:SP family arabinose:H+ symporter-like MFS transporter
MSSQGHADEGHMERADGVVSAGTRGYLAAISFVAALGGFLFGFDTAVVSGTLEYLRSQFSLTPVMEGIVVSSALVGCMMGALLAGSLSDRFGRKASLVVSAVLFLVSAAGCAVPPDVGWLIVARWLGGLGIGMASMLSPMYIAEVSPPHVRGRLVAFYQLAITIGIVVAYFSNVWLQWMSQHSLADLAAGPWRWMLVDEVWRGMFGIGALPAVGFLVSLFLVPETPRWLAKQGRWSEARQVLERIVGSREADRELGEIRQALGEETASLRQLLEPGLRIALAIGILLPFFSQVSGINAIVYYGTTIFAKAGWELSASLGGQAYVGFVNVVFTLVAVAVVDRFGRKPLLLAGIAGLVLALISAAILFALELTNWQLVAILMFYVACFAFSLGPIPWIIIAEIFPTRIRGRAMAVGTFTIWLTNTLVMLVFPTLRDEVGPARTFALFAVLVAPALLLTWLLIPETKGRSLEDIERSWRRRGGSD